MNNLSLERLVVADHEMRRAQEAYENAVRICVQAGLSNVKIAASIGKSESAIRMYRKRKGF